MIQYICSCGRLVKAETEDEFVTKLEAHFLADHRDLVGKYSTAELLEMADKID